METLTLNPTNTTDLLALSDQSIEAWFAQSGLDVTVVNHCDDTGCPECRAWSHAEAA